MINKKFKINGNCAGSTEFLDHGFKLNTKKNIFKLKSFFFCVVWLKDLNEKFNLRHIRQS